MTQYEQDRLHSLLKLWIEALEMWLDALQHKRQISTETYEACRREFIRCRDTLAQALAEHGLKTP